MIGSSVIDLGGRAVVVILLGGVVATKAQQAPEQGRVPGMSRTIPGERGVIAGRVVESGTGRPIAGARVEVRGPADQQYVTTTKSGRYETRPLMAGPYAVSRTSSSLPRARPPSTTVRALRSRAPMAIGCIT